MKDYVINAGIQFVPLTGESRYNIIDRAIAIIQASGLKHRVCPFETVVEGRGSSVHDLLRRLQQEMTAHCDEFLINIRIHAAGRDLAFEEKTRKFEI